MVEDRYIKTLIRALCSVGCLLLAGLTPCATVSAAPILRSEIVPQSGSTDDLFVFTVTIEGLQDKVTPQLSTSNDFSVQLLGPKTSISIINGAISSQQSYVYQLVPKRAGQLKTPEAQVEINGETLSAAPISVSISGSGQAADPAASLGQSPTTGKGQLFMNQTATPQQVYLGQQILNSIGVYTQVNLAGVKIKDDTLDGFWQEVISDGQNSKRMIAGQEYASVNISRALFPLRTGDVKIPAREAVAQVPVTQKRNPFGGLDPFGGDIFEELFQRTVIQERNLRSDEILVEVVALPAPPKELAQFIRGMTIVGDTTMHLAYSDLPIKVGETKKINLRITSTGHLNPLKSIPLVVPEGVKVYDGQAQVSHDTKTGKLITEKTFTYSIVPTQPGTIRIPGASLGYFDPESKSYKLATTSDISLMVTGSPQNSNNSLNLAPGSATASPTSNPNAIPTLPPIAVAPNLNYSEKGALTRLAERISVQLSLLFLAASVLVVGLGAVLLKARGGLDTKRQATAKLKAATDIEQIERAVREWLTTSLPNARAGATFDELRAIISSQPGKANNSLELLTLLDDLELARYGGSKSSSLEELRQNALKKIASYRD